MVRRFLPVGQGAFYCEQFDNPFDTARINVVYDCGSTKYKVLDTIKYIILLFYYMYMI